MPSNRYHINSILKGRKENTWIEIQGGRNGKWQWRKYSGNNFQRKSKSSVPWCKNKLAERFNWLFSTGKIVDWLKLKFWRNSWAHLLSQTKFTQGYVYISIWIIHTFCDDFHSIEEKLHHTLVVSITKLCQMRHQRVLQIHLALCQVCMQCVVFCQITCIREFFKCDYNVIENNRFESYDGNCKIFGGDRFQNGIWYNVVMEVLCTSFWWCFSFILCL